MQISSKHHCVKQIRRAIAPPMPTTASDAVSAIIELVAVHIRQCIPSLSSLTLNDLLAVLGDLREPLREIIDGEIDEACEAVLDHERGQ
jgi:hypothetical protein